MKDINVVYVVLIVFTKFLKNILIWEYVLAKFISQITHLYDVPDLFFFFSFLHL